MEYAANETEEFEDLEDLETRRRRRGELLTSDASGAAVIFDVTERLWTVTTRTRGVGRGVQEHWITAAYEAVRGATGWAETSVLPLVAGISDESPKGTAITRRRGETSRRRCCPACVPSAQARACRAARGPRFHLGRRELWPPKKNCSLYWTPPASRLHSPPHAVR